jgi:CxxC motif-containing protein (DUF1111 family)
MGITSPLRPDEIPNPDGLTDDTGKPGIDVSYDSVNSRAMYVRLIAIPERVVSAAGDKLFDDALCSVCHAPSLATRSDYPVASIVGTAAAVYTDFLLHDMGDELADGLPVGVEGEAGPRDWRTAPLIGLRFNREFMHDGRAKTVEDAIEMHRGNGSEANVAVDAFDSLSHTDRAELLEFVSGL